MTAPALARGGGHHHGECGEHHGRYYACSGPRYEEQHHGGRGRHHFEGYRYRDRSDLAPTDDRSGTDDPAAPGAPPSAEQWR